MAFSFINSAVGNNTGSGTVLNCGTSLDIQAGDLIVAHACWEGGTTTVAISDGGSNALTMEDVVAGSTIWTAMGYKLAGVANAAATFTLTLGAARTYRDILVLQFRPDSGETVTKVAGPSSAVGSSNTPLSSTISPAGTDLVVVGGVGHYDYNESNWLIGGVSADGYRWPGQPYFSGIWYKIYSSSQSSIAAQCTLGGSAAWACNILAFNSVGAAGPPVGGMFLTFP